MKENVARGTQFVEEQFQLGARSDSTKGRGNGAVDDSTFTPARGEARLRPLRT
jgi:hypothetical protein